MHRLLSGIKNDFILKFSLRRNCPQDFPWKILKIATFGQLVLKNATLQYGLRFTSLFNSEFDRIAPSFFTNKEDKRGERGQT